MSPRRSVRSISAFVAVLVLSAPGNADPPFFMGLGDLPGGGIFSQAFAVSADGLVVVGVSSSANGGEAFRWTQAGGMVGLGDLPGGSFSSVAWSVSGDGSVVVGKSGGSAFRWAGGTMSNLGNLPGGSGGSATGVSADGLVVTGTAGIVGGQEAFRWENGVMSGLGCPMGAVDMSCVGWGMSDDGFVFVGHFGNPLETAFRWEAGVSSGLGYLGAGWGSVARDCSADGSVVVGLSDTTSGISHAFRWQNGTMIDINTPPWAGSSARAVSADGSVVVGAAGNIGPAEAFVWYEGRGMFSVGSISTPPSVGHSLLNDFYCVDTTGWDVSDAYGVSADGRTIVGLGTNPNGDPEGWIAHLPEVLCTLGDFDGDGVVTPTDQPVFVSVILDPCGHTLSDRCAADMNLDFAADGADVTGFVAALLGR